LPQTVEPWWELLAAFQRRYPDIQVYVYSTERRVDLIEDGIDVALRVGPIVHDAMVARRILSFRHILVASPELVERFGLPDEPDALHRFPCAVWASRIDVPARWELGGHVVEPKPVLATKDTSNNN
jgi:DNA-binding transcriptional LysR family regulator